MKLSVIECVLSPEMHASDLGTNHVFEGFYSKWEHPKQISGDFLLSLSVSLSLKLSMNNGFSNQPGFLLKIWIPWPHFKLLK